MTRDSGSGMTEVGRAAIGVMRSVLDLGTDLGHEVDWSGTLWVQPVDDGELSGHAVLYMLDAGRLSEMFADARTGATDDDLFLALDAAALDDPDHPYGL